MTAPNTNTAPATATAYNSMSPKSRPATAIATDANPKVHPRRVSTARWRQDAAQVHAHGAQRAGGVGAPGGTASGGPRRDRSQPSRSRRGNGHSAQYLPDHFTS